MIGQLREQFNDVIRNVTDCHASTEMFQVFNSWLVGWLIVNEEEIPFALVQFMPSVNLIDFDDFGQK